MDHGQRIVNPNEPKQKCHMQMQHIVVHKHKHTYNKPAQAAWKMHFLPKIS